MVNNSELSSLLYWREEERILKKGIETSGLFRVALGLMAATTKEEVPRFVLPFRVGRRK